MPGIVETDKLILAAIFAHWDKNEELCLACNALWRLYSTSERREIRHNYEGEKENSEFSPEKKD